MPGKDAFEVDGTVTAVEPSAVVWVRLENGHRLLGFRSGALRRAGVTLDPGDRVTVELSPFDLSKGRIIAKQERN